MKRQQGLRKIENGSVRFFGRVFKPKHNEVYPYKGELDGEKWFFISYGKSAPDLLAMWGSAAFYRASLKGEVEIDKFDMGREKNIHPKTKVIRWNFWVAQ